jgi:DNA-binding HxlR family transcriptional regulator
MAALDLLGHRWALRVLWELQAGPLGARPLLARCDGLSPSVLYDRLRELTEAGLICREGQDYALTALGQSLRDAIGPLDAWSKQWAKQLG